MSTKTDLSGHSPDALTAWIRTELAGADTAAVREVRDALLALERVGGVGEAHRLASGILRERLRLVHGSQHAEGFSAFAVSPCGSYLATGGHVTADDYHAGAEVVVWDVRTGQAVHTVTGVCGGVGWRWTPGQLHWADSETLYLGHHTNSIGRLEPFATLTADSMTTADLTDGWGSPPAFAVGPDGELTVLVHGPDEHQTVACFRLGDTDVDRDDCQWLDNRVPDELRARDKEAGADADDPAYAIGAVYSGARVYRPNADRVLVHNGDELLAFDRRSRRLRWRVRVHGPVGLSSGAEYVAHHPAGIVFHDGRDGLPTPWLPMHVGASALVFTTARGDDAPPRMAAVIEAGNPYGTGPGVHVYDAGEFVCGPDLLPARSDGEHDFPALAWSPDGARFACLTTDHELEIWRVDGHGPSADAHREHRLDGVVADGVVWPQPDRLVLTSEEGLIFVDPLAGLVVSRHGRAAEADHDPATDELPPTGRVAVGGHWVVLRDHTLVAPAQVVDQLGAHVGWAVDRRVGWPLHWSPPAVQAPEATALAPVADFPPAQTAGPAEILRAVVASTAELGHGWSYHRNNLLASAAREFARLGLLDDTRTALAGIDEGDTPARAACVAIVARGGDRAAAEALRDEDPVLCDADLTPDLVASAFPNAYERCCYGSTIGAMYAALGDRDTADGWLALAEATVDTDEANPGQHRCMLAHALVLAGLDARAAELLRRPFPRDPSGFYAMPLLLLLAREGRWELFDAYVRRPTGDGSGSPRIESHEVMQIVARYGDDRTVVAYARLFEDRMVVDRHLDPAGRAEARTTPSPSSDDIGELRAGYGQVMRRSPRRRGAAAEELADRAVAVGHWSAALMLLDLLDGTDMNNRPRMAERIARRALTGLDIALW